MVWTVTLNALTIWYWVLICVILIACIIGAYLHGTFLPILWGGFVSAILYICAEALEPLIFGYQYYDMYSIPWILVSLFGILFFGVQITYLYNIVTKGTVIE